MNWKEQLSKLEQSKDCESSIALIQRVINKNSNSTDAYLSMNYLLMNLLVEEDYDYDKHDYYAGLLKKYFIESYTKFCNNPEYLFYIGQIALISEWYYDIDTEKAQHMLKKASELEPNNILYKWANYSDLDMGELENREKIFLYTKQALSYPEVKKELKSKGALGKYILSAYEYWSNPDRLTSF